MIDFKKFNKIQKLIDDLNADLNEYEKDLKKSPEDHYLTELIKRTKRLITELEGMKEFYKLKKI